MVNTKLRDWIIENKVVVYCETKEEAKQLLKITIGYDLSTGSAVKEEILLTGTNSTNWAWQDGCNKQYFIRNIRAKQCIDFKDLPFIKPNYELW